MKILHVVEAYGGGVFTVVNQLCNGLVGDHEVVLAHSVRPETPADYPRYLDPRVRRIELSLQREPGVRADLAGLWALIRLLTAERSDVIHLHSSKAGFLGRLAAFLTGNGRRVLYSPHALAYLSPNLPTWKRKLYFLLERFAGGLCGRLVACSADEYTEAARISGKRAHVNNAIDLEEIAKVTATVEAKRSRPDQPLRVGTLGRVTAAKRPELFAEVARIVQARSEVPVEFLWIGGGDSRAFPPGSSVRQTGWVRREFALEMLRSEVDVYLQTSSYEGLPLAVLEAQAFGIPAVVTPAPGNKSAIVHAETGYVAVADDAYSLASDVLVLLRSGSLRERMGVKAAAHVALRHKLPLMLQHFTMLYQHTERRAGTLRPAA